ncbi:MAG: T9SS type A sorting domain-containing protein [Bacteroidota bacterium]|nr:T9SS type A sorting domain-containing protein [Bacteroidota bacterium]
MVTINNKNIFTQKRSPFIYLISYLLLCIGTAESQWIPTNGPYGGSVYSLGVVGTNLFIGTDVGVFHSSDLGVKWVNLKPKAFKTVTSFVTSGSNLLAGTSNGIFLSSDNGKNWVAINSGLTDLSIRQLSTNDTNIFAVTYNGTVFHSSDNGTSWVIAESLSFVRSIAIKGSSVFAGSFGGLIYRSTDNGEHWTSTNTGSILSVEIHKSNIFAGTNDGHLFRSTDNGNSWNDIKTFIIEGIEPKVEFLFSTDSDLFAEVSGHIFRSNDSGNNWTKIDSGLSDSPSVFTITKIGSILFAGTYDRGIFYSLNNGDEWLVTNFGSKTYDFSIAATSSNILVSTVGGFFQSKNNGGDWSFNNLGLVSNYSDKTRIISSIVMKDSNIYLGTDGAGIYRSTNNGNSWMSFSEGLPNTIITALIIKDSIIFAGTLGGGIYNSTNNGINWVSSNISLSGNVVNAFTIKDSILFAGTNAGVFQSINNGKNWTAINSGLTFSNVSSLVTNGNVVIAGTYSGIFRSINNGASWLPADSGLSGLQREIYCLAAHGLNIFAGAFRGGVFLSRDNGISWISFGDSLSTVYKVNSLAIDDKNLYAALDENLVWKRSLSDVLTNISSLADHPREFTLVQNYPNPFNSSTKIVITLPSQHFVSLRVYDILGREVALLINDILSKGSHEVSFKATNLSSGIYFYQLKSDGILLSKKMILQK